MEVERSDDHPDVAAVRHRRHHQEQAERRTCDAARKTETPDRKHFPQGLEHPWLLQCHSRLTIVNIGFQMCSRYSSTVI